jgi:hypothetical protein
MKVIELMAYLSAMPENTPVYMSIDDEGNDFKPLDEAVENRFRNYTKNEEFMGVILWPGWDKDEIEPIGEGDDEDDD